MKAITVCVDYADRLSLTLPWNFVHFQEVLVITSPGDAETEGVVKSVPNARLYRTDAFYRNGADFNKGLAIEEGFDVLGRDGWICHLDADVALPRRMDLPELDPQRLYLCRRRLADTVTVVPADWGEYEIQEEELHHPGYFQLFHSDARVLQNRPWYPVDWRHAGGSDTEFNEKWAGRQRVCLPFEVLHLGRPFQNWCGRGGGLRMAQYWATRRRTRSYEAEKLPPES